MKKMRQIEPNYEITDGSAFGGFYIKASFEEMLDKLKQPSTVGSGDDKVQLTWIYYERLDENNSEHHDYKCLTIYDYKMEIPIYAITEWNVGSKNISKDKVHSYLLSLGFTRDQIIESKF